MLTTQGALCPFFYGLNKDMAKIDQLNEIVAPAVEAVGFEFVGLEYIAAGKHSILRIFIDHENGINVDNCAEVSHQVSAVMDVEDPISSEYRLEVSSPGAERPLFTAKQFAQFMGDAVQVKLHRPLNGRRNFKGKISSVSDELVSIEVDGEVFEFSITMLEKANLIPVW